MTMFKSMSLQIKFVLIFLMTVILVAGALFAGLYQLRRQVLRNEAQAVADQVVSFRAWVAQTGMVWVDHLAPGFHDYLAESDGTNNQKWYGKNPALATRELSAIANASSQRTSFRVTSDEYRQPANAPDAFEISAIKAFKANHGVAYFDDFRDGKYRYAQPIYVKEECLKCHGDPQAAPQAVIDKYGADKAFGYQVGQVRGIISVKLPDITLGQILPVLTNPLTIGLLLLAFVINFLYVNRSIIRRVRALTQRTEAIAAGEIDAELIYPDPQGTRDEIDHLYNAVALLRNSLRVAMRRLQRK